MTVKLRDRMLKSSLNKDGLFSLYLIAGNDAFLMDRCTELIAAAVDGERVNLDFSSSSNEEIAQHLSSFSFGSKLLVIDNFKASEYTEAKRELYSSYLDMLPTTLTVVVKLFSDSPKFSLPKAAEGFCSLCPHSAIVECLHMQGGELIGYIENLAKRQGSEIASDASHRLAELCGDDLQLMSNEIAKLAAASGYGKITRALVDDMCRKTTEENVFSFVNFIERGKTREAVSVLYEMLETEDPSAVLGAIASSYVNLARAKTAVAEHKSAKQTEEDFLYSKNNRALAVAFDKQGKYSDKQLCDIIALLSDTDMSLKSGGDKQIILEQAMVRLALIVRAKR